MRLSVVIPCYNAASTLALQLEALEAQQWRGEWEVIVADNRSSDESREIARLFRDRLPSFQLVDAARKRGAAHARNVGACQARGDWLAFCDADDVVDAGWLAALAEESLAHDFIASRFDFTKLNVTPVSHAQSQGLQRVAYPPRWPHAGGSGLAVRRGVHVQVGGFDESLPYLEDTDYCFRIQRAGYELHFAPAALVHVRLPAASAWLFNQARHWAQYNQLMYRRFGAGQPLDHPWVVYVQTWRALLRCLPRALRPETRAAWTKTLGTQIGLLQGAIRFRVPPVQ